MPGLFDRGPVENLTVRGRDRKPGRAVLVPVPVEKTDEFPRSHRREANPGAEFREPSSRTQPVRGQHLRSGFFDSKVAFGQQHQAQPDAVGAEMLGEETGRGIVCHARTVRG